MELYENKELFQDLVRTVSRRLGISPELVEKDYYVTVILKRIKEEIPDIIFKGGTSLSKCYDIIDRFSEDIDLTLDKNSCTQSNKRKANKKIIKICDDLGFTIVNREEVENHSHGNFNCYNIEYPMIFNTEILKQYIKVELVFFQKSYPDTPRKVNSFIGAFLKETQNLNEVTRYNLNDFDVRTQTLERTFIDKVFAVCDYYLSNNFERNSRHIYDLSKLVSSIKLQDKRLKSLIDEVREDRKNDKNCLSAQDGIDINNLLEEIIAKDFFKKDYNKDRKSVV